jgi:molybdopterin-biosynthesis enzyme MoeA-like protein
MHRGDSISPAPGGRYTSIMRATILSVGSELTTGRTVDTNSAWLAGELEAAGVPVRAHVTLPDDEAEKQKSPRRSRPPRQTAISC